jgi:DDE superfamily endonuclease
VICLDELGPESVRSVPGRRLVPPATDAAPRPRATQELDYGRRGSGYVFGASVPATGAVLTMPAPRRTTAAFLALLEQVEAWLDPDIGQVYAILDNLHAHRALDVLLWALAHPRWEFVFQPKYAAYLNLLEPWWKVLRSLAFHGRRFETWAAVCDAVAAATRYWNAHRHPFTWGTRKRRRPARPPGIATLPIPA